MTDQQRDERQEIKKFVEESWSYLEPQEIEQMVSELEECFLE